MPGSLQRHGADPERAGARRSIDARASLRACIGRHSDPHAKSIAADDDSSTTGIGRRASDRLLSAGWLPAGGPLSVGLTSGASTPDNLVGAAIVKLAEFCK